MRSVLVALSFMIYSEYHTQLTASQRDAGYTFSAIAAHKIIAQDHCSNRPIKPIAQQPLSVIPDTSNTETPLIGCSLKKNENVTKNALAVQEEIPPYDDPNLLPYLIAIVGNFGKVLLDPTNTPNVVLCIGQIIDNIIYVAREVTRAPLATAQKDLIISALHKEIKRVIVAYKYVQHRPIYKH
jgi:hypothetical protein